jgi:signal transduction histidine kinase
MTLRKLYKLDGWIMLIVGFSLWGGWPALAFNWLGIRVTGYTPESFAANINLWQALAFSGAFGGALMAFGFASLAVGRSTDLRFLQTACGYFLAGHSFLSFIVFVKAEALWDTQAAFLLVDIVAFPGAGFLYYFIADASRSGVAKDGPRGTKEDAIREAAGQEERARLAQDLHDSVKQQIYSIQANLATVQARWETDKAGARAAVEQARSLSRDAMAETIALLDRLRQDPIESVGLVEALRRQCEALGYQTGAAVTTTFGALPAGNRVPPGAMKSVFRIAQEALANVARHARAKHVQLDVGGNAADDEFVLCIRDDGHGFEIASAARGMGISNMQARAKEIGARLELQSKPGEGAVATLHLPLLDPRGESLRRHVRLLLAVTIPAALLSWVAAAFAEWRPHVLPLVVLAAAFGAYQAWTLVRLRWL